MTQIPSTILVQRLTILWAFSEAALGGILHIFKIPFTGLFIGSSAVVLVSLIAYFSESKGDIVKSMILILIIKGLVSPHTPLTSYAAVALQGLLAMILFRYLPWKAAAFTLGVMALLLSSFQKFIVVTLVFGMDIWHSIDLFGSYILQQFLSSGTEASSVPISISLICIYAFFHVLAGLIVGSRLPRLARKLENELQGDPEKFTLKLEDVPDVELKKGEKRKMLKKITTYFLYILIAAIMILSYVYPVFEENQGFRALIMFIRSIIIMSAWYFIVGPLVLKKLKKYLNKKQNSYTSDVKYILEVLPLFRKVALYCWRESAGHAKIKRIKYFIFLLLIRILIIDLRI